MTSAAIIMMSVAILIIWGGLAFSLVHLIKNPEGSVTLLDDDGYPIHKPQHQLEENKS